MSKEEESNPNFRAKDCLNFFKNGFCSYGRRCCFKHDERKLNEKNLETDVKVLLSLCDPQGSRRLPIFLNLTSNHKKELFRSTTSDSENLRSLDTTHEEICLEEN